MTIADAFTEDITTRPDDLEPRLIFADWLEEQNDPRGAFIRTQIERSRLRPGDPLRATLRLQEGELLNDHVHAWVGPCGRLVSGWRFQRGFIESITIDAGVFLHNAARLLRHWPLRRVRFLAAGRHLHDLAFCPHLARLESIDLSCNALDANGMATLGLSPHLGKLRRLNLAENHLGDNGLYRLSRCRRMSGLAWLNLSGNGICDRGASALSETLHFPRLTRLNIADNHIGDAGAAALAGCRFASTLRSFDLSENNIGLRGVASLLEAPGLRRLKKLELRGNRVMDDGASDLAALRSQSSTNPN